jgi:Undecaprenyl-phosphate galactose phosphotransferase WbaP
MSAPAHRLERTAAADLAPQAVFRERKWVPAALVLADIAALEIALAAGFGLRVAASTWFPVSVAPVQFRGIALGILAVPLVCALAGLYPGYGLASVQRLRLRVKATFFVLAGLNAWGYLVERELWSRGILLATMLVALVLLPLVERLLVRLLVHADLWGSPVLVVGTGRRGAAIARRLRTHRGLGLVPVAVLDVEDEAWSGLSLAAAAGLHLSAHQQETPTTAVVAVSGFDESRLHALLESLPFPLVIVMPDMAPIQSQSITPVDIGGELGLALKRNLLVPWNRRTKRAIDIGASLLATLAAAPVIALCACWIRMVSPGPVFYPQLRVGLGRRPIRIWKLRSMYPQADQRLETWLNENPQERQEWARHFKLRNDPRILPGVGRFLRRTSLDELPQLWNVLRGDMSLVGPRPLPSYHLAAFDEDFRRLRERVLPGLTGLWQVSARSDGSLAAQKALDTYYIRNWSLWLDIEIAVRTVRAVWEGRGAR